MAANASVAASKINMLASEADDSRLKLERSARRMRAAEVRSYARQSRHMAWTIDNLYFYVLEQSWTVCRELNRVHLSSVWMDLASWYAYMAWISTVDRLLAMTYCRRFVFIRFVH